MAANWKTDAVAKQITRYESKKKRGEYVYHFEAITRLPDERGAYGAYDVTEFHYDKLQVPDVTTPWTAAQFVTDRLLDAGGAMTMRDKVDYSVWIKSLRDSGMEPSPAARIAWLRARSREASKALKTSVVESMDSYLDRDDHRAEVKASIERVPNWRTEHRYAMIHSDATAAQRRRSERNPADASPRERSIGLATSRGFCHHDCLDRATMSADSDWRGVRVSHEISKWPSGKTCPLCGGNTTTPREVVSPVARAKKRKPR